MTSKEDYTWDNAVRDLAMLSPLTLMEAHRVCRDVEAAGLNPYDALRPLTVMFSGASVEERSASLLVLITLPKE